MHQAHTSTVWHILLKNTLKLKYSIYFEIEKVRYVYLITTDIHEINQCVVFQHIHTFIYVNIFRSLEGTCMKTRKRGAVSKRCVSVYLSP